MRSPRTLMASVTVVAALALAATACGGKDTSSSAEAAASTTAVVPAAAAIIIDVRTPEEFAAGHLQGAVNYNVEDGTLDRVLQSLDPSANYLVYCRSGRRSALATSLLNGAGFARVTDLGALDDAASSTGLPVVTG